MSLIQEVEINRLQPTDLNLDFKTLSYYASTFPLLRESPLPEIWMIDREMCISDGHHQIYDMLQRGSLTVFAKCYTPENCKTSLAAYGYVLTQILKKAQKAKSRGIKHISDLKVI